MSGEIRLWHFYACPRLSVDPQMTPKRKFVLPVMRESTLSFGYLVNSRTSSWLQKRPHLLCCRAFISVEDQPFLNQRSFLGCHRLFSITVERCPQFLEAATSTTVQSVLSAIENCPEHEEGQAEGSALSEERKTAIRTSSAAFLKN